MFNNEKGFNDLVSKGIIDEATAEKMTTFMEEKLSKKETCVEKTDPGDKILSDLLNKGIITNDQLEKMKTAFEKDGGMGIRKDSLSDLVTNGIIDQATANKLSTYFSEKFANKPQGRGPGGPGGPGKHHGPGHKDKLFDEMVDAGILTKDQVDKIKSTMPKPPM